MPPSTRTTTSSSLAGAADALWPSSSRDRTARGSRLRLIDESGRDLALGIFRSWPRCKTWSATCRPSWTARSSSRTRSVGWTSERWSAACRRWHDRRHACLPGLRSALGRRPADHRPAAPAPPRAPCQDRPGERRAGGPARGRPRRHRPLLRRRPAGPSRRHGPPRSQPVPARPAQRAVALDRGATRRDSAARPSRTRWRHRRRGRCWR